MKVLADKYLYRIEDCMPQSVECQLFDPADGLSALDESIDALLIRTTTTINATTISEFPASLRFIGTGSAGTDHVDRNYLQANHIAFANAAGCNARSVAEYVAVAQLLWAETFNYRLTDYTTGLIGAGQTGSATQHLLERLGISTVAYDPPRAARDATFSSATLDEVLGCDILSFHVPLTTEGDAPTYHWLDQQKLDDHHFSCVINASRGGVVDEQVLCKAHKDGVIDHFIVDVWENEPVFNDDTARRAFIKTPHIAGYSVQAKLNASRMIVESLKETLAIPEPLPSVTETPRPPQSPGHFWSLSDALTFLHPIEDYQTRLQMLIGRDDEAKGEQFNHIRSTHPLRHELTTFGSIYDNEHFEDPHIHTLLDV